MLLFLTASLQLNPAQALDKHESSYEIRLLDLINQYRTENGLSPLSFDRTLNKLARAHSRYMEGKDVLGHDNFEERFRESGRSSCVENIGWNYSSPDDQLLAWKKSKRHNANLLNKKMKIAGIAKAGAYVTFFACD